MFSALGEPPGHVTTTLLIDRTGGSLLLRSLELRTPTKFATWTYGDYREVGGRAVPFHCMHRVGNLGGDESRELRASYWLTGLDPNLTQEHIEQLEQPN